VILGLFRFVFYLIIAYIIYLFLRLLMAPRRRARPGRAAREASGIMVKDEVCNTYLPRDDAIRENWDGKEFFFCSPACRGKFLEQRKRGG
jgi:YHS domain-containing protein